MRVMIKFMIVGLTVAAAAMSVAGQMTDARFLGLKGKVRSVSNERTFTFTTGKERLNQPLLVKTNYYDKKGFLTTSATFDGGESRRIHTFAGADRKVSRHEFNASGKTLPMKGSCSVPGRQPVDPNFDYFYSYQRDTRKRIVGVTEYCDAASILTRSVFRFNDRNRVISDVRCQPRSNTCENNYYEFSKGRLISQKVTTSSNGVEKCISLTVYSGHEFDKKGNEIKRVGVTSDCTNDKLVFYRFIDTARISYY